MKNVIFVTLLLLACVACVGCRTAATSANTFTVDAAPELEASADLATTAHSVSREIESKGAEPHSKNAVFLVNATNVWKNQTGPGKTIGLSAASVDKESRKITSAKVGSQKKAETERVGHKKELSDAAARVTAAEELANNALVNAMWSKLGAILAVGLLGVGVCLYWRPLKSLAPIVATVAVGFASTVVALTCLRELIKDLWIVGLSIGGLTVLIVAGYLAWKWWQRAHDLKEVVEADQVFRDNAKPDVKAEHTVAHKPVSHRAKAAVDRIKKGS